METICRKDSLYPVGFRGHMGTINLNARCGWEEISGLKLPFIVKIVKGTSLKFSAIVWKIRNRINKFVDSRGKK